jgi:hypothetical protein
MSEFEQRIRERAYELWRHAGRPEGRGDEFWFAARREFEGDGSAVDGDAGSLIPPLEEPPVVAVQHGAPTGMPGERIAEQGVIDDRLGELVEELSSPIVPRPIDD